MGRCFDIRSAILIASCVCVVFWPNTTVDAATTVSLQQRDIELVPEADTTSDKHVGQLILVAKELPKTTRVPVAMLPCTTGAAAASTGQPHLQAFCDVSGGLPSLSVEYESEYLGENNAEHRWSITARVSGFPSKRSTVRYASATIDGASYWLSISYKTPADETVTLQVAQPTRRWLVQEDEQRVSLQVLSKGASSSTISLVNSSLQDGNTNKRINVDAFKLCNDVGCNTEVAVPGEETTVIFLQADSSAIPYGEFKGNLIFAADGAALSNSVELTVLSSGVDIRLLGVVLIAAGVLIAWLITVFAPHQSQRLEELRPAIVIRDSAAAWLARAANADQQTGLESDRSKAQLEQIQDDLGDDQLKTLGYVPGRWPPMSKASRKPIETYQIYLKGRNDRLNVIARVVSTGIEAIASDWEEYEAGNHVTEAAQALDDLDKLSGTAALNSVDRQIDTILTKLDTATSGAGRSVRSGFQRGTRISSDELATQLDTLNVGVWAIWVLITIASGWAALILSNSGFGSTRDLFSCFGWGLGLQAIGPKLSQLTTASITKQVKFSIPG